MDEIHFGEMTVADVDRVMRRGDGPAVPAATDAPDGADTDAASGVLSRSERRSLGGLGARQRELI